MNNKTVYNYAQDIMTSAKENSKEFVEKDVFINQAKKECLIWLEKTNRLNKRFVNILNRLRKDPLKKMTMDNKLHSEDMTQVYNAYINATRHIVNLRTQEEIIQHMVTGYKLIHNIREVLTRQEIIYSVAYEKDGQIWQTELKMEDLLKNVSKNVERNIKESTMAEALKISVSNANILKTLESIKNKTEKVITENTFKENVEIDIHNSLYNYIYYKIQNITEKKKTHGDIYEIYLVMINEKKYKPFHSLANGNSDNLIEVLADAHNENILEGEIKQAHDSVAGWRGGDVGNLQAKAVYNASASLMNIGTMKRVISSIYENFSAKQIDEQEIIKLFTKEQDKLNLELDKIANTNAINGIQETFKNWGFKVQ